MTIIENTTTGQLNSRVASELLAEAEAVRLRLSWLLRDTKSALTANDCPPATVAQLAETTDYAMASLAAIVLTIKEGAKL